MKRIKWENIATILYGFVIIACLIKHSGNGVNGQVLCFEIFIYMLIAMMINVSIYYVRKSLLKK